MKLRAAKILMAGVSPLFLLAMTGHVLAQSTATQQLETIESVTVTGQSESFGGVMAPITVAK